MLTTNLSDRTGSGAITALNENIVADTESLSSVIFNVTGTWVATVALQGSFDGINWISVAGVDSFQAALLTITANSRVIINCGGYKQIRLIATAFTSGTINITWGAGLGLNSVAAWNAGIAGLSTTAKLQDGQAINITSQANGSKRALDVGIDVAGVQVDPREPRYSALATYSAAFMGIVPAATPTDYFTVTGSATKTIIITKLQIAATTTAVSQATIVLLKRSSANSGGTSTTLANTPHDSTSAAGTAVVRFYTANPTVGNFVGNFRSYKMQIGATATAIGPMIFENFGEAFRQGITLRGTGEVFAVNGNSTSFAAGANLNMAVEWIEF